MEVFGSVKQILHVAQDAIRKQNGSPAIIIRDYKGAKRTHEAALIVDGREVGRFVYRPHKPLSCGARLWLEVDTDLCQIVGVEPNEGDETCVVSCPTS